MLKIDFVKILRFLFLITASFFFFSPKLALTQSPEVTIIFILRHAEKSSSTRDSSLNPAGRARAEQLVHVLAEADIEAIYSTSLKRTKETAEPLVNFLKQQIPQSNVNINFYSSPNEVAEQVKINNTGQRILIVSHSGMVEEIIEQLNGDRNVCPIGDYNFDNLCIVILGSSGESEVIHLQYGAPSSDFANLQYNPH